MTRDSQPPSASLSLRKSELRNFRASDLRNDREAVVFLSLALAVVWFAHPAAAADLYAGQASSGAVYTAPVTGPGVLGAWSSTSARPGAISEFWWCFVAGYVYQVAGNSNSSCYSAQDLGGGLSGWSSQTAFPTTCYNPVTVTDTSGAYLYEASGASPSGCGGLTTSYSASISGGAIGGWNPSSVFPSGRIEHACATDGSYMYVMGGLGAGCAALSDVYSASIGSGAIGTWNTQTPLPAGRSYLQAVACGGYLYVIGGGSWTTPAADVWSAPITGGGTVGAWTSQSPLPVATGELGLGFISGYIYVAGGWTPSLTSAVYSAQTLAGGGLSAWTSQNPLPFSEMEAGIGPIEVCAVVATPTVTPTHTPSRTRTPTRTPTTTMASVNTPVPTPTCPLAYASATPPFLLVDKNVFNPDAEYLQIVWAVKDAGQVQVSIFNSAGEFIRRLDLGTCGAGGQLYHAVWDGKNFQDKLVSGNVYILRLVTLGAPDAIVRRVAVQR